MTTVEEIEKAIENLAPEQVSEVRDWLVAFAAESPGSRQLGEKWRFPTMRGAGKVLRDPSVFRAEAELLDEDS